MGDLGCFSFYPTKVLGCYGDGGMIAAASAEIAERLRRLRNHGATQPFIHNDIGYNSRLDEIQAALLRIKLRHIEHAIQARRAVAASYGRRLQEPSVTLPNASEPNAGHVFNLYTVRTNRRDHIRQRLSEYKVGSSVCYPLPLHLQEVYRHLGYKPGDLPVAERAAAEVLSLPIYPDMDTAYVEQVCEVIRQALNQ
jgi:dTDP-4-amino-4,6-dideoxygalactose transaminase